MGYKVTLTADAKEDLLDLAGNNRARLKLIATALKKLEDEPDKRGKPLGSKGSGNLTTFYKLVVGRQDYRVIYRIEGREIVVVWVIAARSDSKCYKLAVARLQTYPDRELAAQLTVALDAAWSGAPSA